MTVKRCCLNIHQSIHISICCSNFRPIGFCFAFSVFLPLSASLSLSLSYIHTLFPLFNKINLLLSFHNLKQSFYVYLIHAHFYVPLLHRKSEDDNVQMQLQLFDEHERTDEEEHPGTKGIDLGNPLDVFHAILRQVSSQTYVLETLRLCRCFSNENNLSNPKCVASSSFSSSPISILP